MEEIKKNPVWGGGWLIYNEGNHHICIYQRLHEIYTTSVDSIITSMCMNGPDMNGAKGSVVLYIVHDFVHVHILYWAKPELSCTMYTCMHVHALKESKMHLISCPDINPLVEVVWLSDLLPPTLIVQAHLQVPVCRITQCTCTWYE